MVIKTAIERALPYRVAIKSAMELMPCTSVRVPIFLKTAQNTKKLMAGPK